MLIRLFACSFALACLLISTAADARHRHRATHYRHPIACQIVTGGGIHLVSRPCRNRLEEGIPVRGSRWVAASRHYAARWRGHRRAYVRRASEPNDAREAFSGGLAHVQTAVGIPITVSLAIKDRMLALIEEMKAIGYVPHSIGCFAAHGHVPHSRHHSGNACDFDGSLSVARFFRTEQAEQLIAKHGLHSGCDYVLHGTRDCGHVDDAVGFARASRGTAHAGHRARYRRHYARNY